MAKKQVTLVYYYVPQDKDDPDCPNVFAIHQNKASIKLLHIYQSFPLKGSYLFRFKYLAEGHIVWLDLPDVDAKLPTFKDKIYMKATRVSWEDSKLHSKYKQKTTIKQQQISNKPQSINFFDNNTTQKKTEQKIPTVLNQSNKNKDLLNQTKVASNNQVNLSNNLLSGLGIPSNPINNNFSISNNSDGLNLLGEFPTTSNPQKKAEINLISNFGHHDDLI